MAEIKDRSITLETVKLKADELVATLTGIRDLIGEDRVDEQAARYTAFWEGLVLRHDPTVLGEKEEIGE